MHAGKRFLGWGGPSSRAREDFEGGDF